MGQDGAAGRRRRVHERQAARREDEKGVQMTHRTKLTAAEIETRCLRALKRSMGLHDITYVKIRPYSGPKSWTWELADAGPDAGTDALWYADTEIKKLQGEFDLKSTDEP